LMTACGITFPFVSEDRVSHSEWDEDLTEFYQYLVELDDYDYVAKDCECCRLRARPFTRLELQSSVEEEVKLSAEVAGEKKIVSQREKDRRRQRKFMREDVR
ncbi:MAG: hypothetical protein KBD29_03730, partial [Candidatus Magasanikbacteria bacterium]|nr:hypothetical protein [Candidatus Magasanikbacteria bacterium]